VVSSTALSVRAHRYCPTNDSQLGPSVTDRVRVRQHELRRHRHKLVTDVPPRDWVGLGVVDDLHFRLFVTCHVPRWTPTLKILLVCGEASAKPLWVIGVFWTVYPTPYRLFPGGDLASNDMGTLSSWMTVLPSPSPPTAGSIRREKRCWWFGARTPGLTTVPYGEVSPGKIACVDRIPVARVSKWRLAAWSNFQHRMY